MFKTKGKTPVIVNSSTNNGVGGLVDLLPLEKGNMITFSDTTTSEGIFYQPEDFIGYSHIQGLYPYELDKWSKNSYLYFKTAFATAVKGKYNYGDKFNRKKAADEGVYLPVKENSEIDFEFMNTYIEAIRKLAVEDILKWRNSVKHKI